MGPASVVGARWRAVVGAMLGAGCVLGVVPAVGSAAVTSISQGQGISISPNPLTSTGTVSLALPLSLSDPFSGWFVSLTNSSHNTNIYGAGSNAGVAGTSGVANAEGVYGAGASTSINTTGVSGFGTGNASGVYGKGGTKNGPGVTGLGQGTGPGVIGTAGSGIAGQFLTNGTSDAQPTLLAQTAGTGPAAIATNTNNKNTANTLNATTNGPGVVADHSQGNAINGFNNNTSGVGAGVRGEVNSIFGNNGTAGVYGVASGTGGYGVYAEHSNSSGFGQALFSTTAGLGVNTHLETTNASNAQATLESLTAGTGPAGTFANNNNQNTANTLNATTNGPGVIADHSQGNAINGFNNNTQGVGAGVRGEVNSIFGNNQTAGVDGIASGTGGYGVYAEHTDTTGFGVALQAVTNDLGSAAVIENNNSSNTNPIFWVQTNGTGPAAQFDGLVHITGNLAVDGSISAGVKDFKIDDPADPANKYLIHTSVESPQAENTYNGNVTTDSKGYATVGLPSYFDAENTDPRYQLTVIGSFATAIVGREEHNNQFVIRTNQPNVKVSWQVTGIRNDAYARSQRAPAEQLKAAADIGHFLYPQGYGKPLSDAIGSARSERRAPAMLPRSAQRGAAPGSRSSSRAPVLTGNGTQPGPVAPAQLAPVPPEPLADPAPGH